ncbi:MAG: hypothetical protein QXN16_03535 [Candidatus Micrarchaeaceae archaeon]
MPDMQVYVALSAPYPVFYVENSYYCFYNNIWYFGPSYNGPWYFVRIVPMQLRRFRPNEWRMLQNRARAYYRNPQWRHFIAQPVKKHYSYEHSKEYNRQQNNNQYSPNSSQYNGGYNNNQYHPQYNQYNRGGR